MLVTMNLQSSQYCSDLGLQSSDLHLVYISIASYILALLGHNQINSDLHLVYISIASYILALLGHNQVNSDLHLVYISIASYILAWSGHNQVNNDLHLMYISIASYINKHCLVTITYCSDLRLLYTCIRIASYIYS